MKPFRRTRFLIDRFQTRILFLHLTYFVALLIIFLSSVFLPLIFRLNSSSLPFTERHTVADQFLSLHAHLWPAVLILFLLLSAHSVFVSHRIAGPLVRFRQVLSAVTAGNLSVRIRLRRKDYLAKEAALIEEMITALREKVRRIKEHSYDLDALVEGFQTDPENRADLGRLRAAIARLATSLDEFDTADPGAEATATTAEEPSLAHRTVPEA